MSRVLKIVIVVAASLIVGFVGGLALGLSGRRSVQQDLTRCRNEAEALRQGQAAAAQECSRRLAAAQTTEALQSARDQLLRALLELYANNYGLTSQHISAARTQLRIAQKGLPSAEAAKVGDLFEKLADAQTLAGRLDPMTRNFIEKVLAALDKIPPPK